MGGLFEGYLARIAQLHWKEGVPKALRFLSFLLRDLLRVEGFRDLGWSLVGQGRVRGF